MHTIVRENFKLQGIWHYKLMIIFRHLKDRYTEQTRIWRHTEIKLHPRSQLHSNKSHKQCHRTLIIWDYVVKNENDNLQTSASNGECLQSLTFIHSSVKKKSDNQSDLKFSRLNEFWKCLHFDRNCNLSYFNYKRIIYKKTILNIFMYAL